MCCSSWICKESDTTERLNNTWIQTKQGHGQKPRGCGFSQSRNPDQQRAGNVEMTPREGETEDTVPSGKSYSRRI